MPSRVQFHYNPLSTMILYNNILWKDSLSSSYGIYALTTVIHTLKITEKKRPKNKEKKKRETFKQIIVKFNAKL